jgi:hypothetical protein
MINLNEYEIPETEYQGIIDCTMALIKPVLSRCIDNKERDSYSDTTKHVESNVVRGKSGINLFPGG